MVAGGLDRFEHDPFGSLNCSWKVPAARIDPRADISAGAEISAGAALTDNLPTALTSTKPFADM